MHIGLELLANILSLDLEHQRLAEAQTKQQAASTTLQQVSMLGGFLAHKIPNVLGTVAWAAKTLDTLLQPPSREHNTLLMESLRASGQQAERLIAQCRSLGRPLYLHAETIPLAPLVLTALGHVTIPLSVEVHQELRSLPAVTVNPTLFSEVVEGVLQNAFDAMPDGGTLYISGDVNANDIRLHIKDTGPGIDPEHQPHLFTTPFFTTKTDTSRLGFSLWLSRLYLQSVGGDIAITATSAAGTTLTISLSQAFEAHSNPQSTMAPIVEPQKVEEHSCLLTSINNPPSRGSGELAGALSAATD